MYDIVINKYLDILHSQWSRRVTESQDWGVVLDDTYCHTIHSSHVEIVHKYFCLYPHVLFFFLCGLNLCTIMTFLQEYTPCIAQAVTMLFTNPYLNRKKLHLQNEKKNAFFICGFHTRHVKTPNRLNDVYQELYMLDLIWSLSWPS